MTKKSNRVINSVKRLEWAVGEYSKITQELKESCAAVASTLYEECDKFFEFNEALVYVNGSQSFDLPRNLIFVQVDNGDKFIAYNEKRPISQMKDFRIDDPECVTRKTALRFSKDVADGLLDEIAGMFEREIKAG